VCSSDLEGLAATQPADNDAPVGEKQTQISTTFAYGAGQGAPPSTVEAPAAGAADAVTAPVPARKRGFGYKFKHFFYKLFHPGKSS